MIIKKYLKPPPRLEWHCSFKRRKHRYGKTVNPSGSTKQSSNITASTKHLCHPPPLSLLNQNCHMGVSLNGGTPRTPQNDHFQQENQWLFGTTILGNPHLGTSVSVLVASFGTPSQASSLPLDRSGDLDPQPVPSTAVSSSPLANLCSFFQGQWSIGYTISDRLRWWQPFNSTLTTLASAGQLCQKTPSSQ